MQAINFIAGTKSTNQQAWNVKAVKTVGVPKQKCDGTRETFLRVLLDEHKPILNSYQAQKHGRGGGWTGEVTQG